MNRRWLAALLWLPLLAATAPQSTYAEPYRILQEANRKLDASLAASAYAADGALHFEIPGRPVESFRGTNSIRAAYARTFGQVDAGTPIDLEFRFEPPGLALARQTGAYRATVTVSGKQVAIYGRFTVELVAENGSWRFAEDRGSVATAADFERLPSIGSEGRP